MRFYFLITTAVESTYIDLSTKQLFEHLNKYQLVKEVWWLVGRSHYVTRSSMKLACEVLYM
jgi:hypothetical protein